MARPREIWRGRAGIAEARAAVRGLAQAREVRRSEIFYFKPPISILTQILSYFKPSHPIHYKYSYHPLP